MANEKMPADVALEGLLAKKQGYGVLYKYQTINAYSLDALRHNYLYFSSFAQLNDPFDPFISLVGSQMGNDVCSALLEKGPRIFCVTADPDSPTMWAHYANACAGMCIGYAVFTGNPRMFNPVQYVTQLPKQVSPTDLLMIKHDGWRHEKEWRATWAMQDNKVDGIAYPVAVYLGPRCTHENMLKVRDALPKTVGIFGWKVPGVESRRFVYGTYEVSEIVQQFGKLPKFDELLATSPN